MRRIAPQSLRAVKNLHLRSDTTNESWYIPASVGTGGAPSISSAMLIRASPSLIACTLWALALAHTERTAHRSQFANRCPLRTTVDCVPEAFYLAGGWALEATRCSNFHRPPSRTSESRYIPARDGTGLPSTMRKNVHFEDAVARSACTSMLKLVIK